MPRSRSSRTGRRAEAVRAQVHQGTAQLVPDPDRADSWTLSVDGTPQSHVDLLDPMHLEFEYVRWLGHVVDTVAVPGASVNVLHLGGGAWTLARYVAATRPGSRQRVVELDGALIDFVRQHLPSRGAGIRVRVGDAREVLGSLGVGTVDLVVVDVYSGARIPSHLTSIEFVRAAARALRPGGTYAANIADGGALAFARAQAATVAAAFAHTCLVGTPQVLRGRRFGNLVILGSRHELAAGELARRTAADPFPARVLAGEGYARFTHGAAAVSDSTATPSPLPPVDVLGIASGGGTQRRTGDGGATGG